MTSSILNILIVVDVQNCFIHGGSLGNDNIEDSIQQITEIEDLIKINKLIIFTRDSHPENHSSFNYDFQDETIKRPGKFPPHCRSDKNCKKESEPKPKEQSKQIQNIITTPLINKQSETIETILKNKEKYTNIMNYLEEPVKGTNLSYLFFITSYASIFKILENNNHIIGLNNDYYEQDLDIQNPAIEWIDFNKQCYKYENKDFIVIKKGEYCKYDAFSAFNYHIDNSTIQSKNLKCEKKYSTGLCEYIEKYIQNKPYTKINITVCGLVGNICVMHTVHQGLIMIQQYENLINKEIKFTFSCLGTLWLPIDHIQVKPNFSIQDEKQNIIKLFKENINTILIINNLMKSLSYNFVFKKNHVMSITWPLTLPKKKLTGGSFLNKYLKYKIKYNMLKEIV